MTDQGKPAATTAATTIASTLVDFPGGAVTGRSPVLSVHRLEGGAYGLVTRSTPFHPLDHSWPDQPGDHGRITVGGAGLTVIDTVTGGLGPDGEFAVGAGIPVRRGDVSWVWVAVHVTGTPVDPHALVGCEADLSVDEDRRAALSAAHTGCHLMALALNEALAHRWTKEARTDALGRPDFDGIAMDTSRMDEFASTDRYRLGKSLRKKGFDAADLTDELPELARKVNARLAQWVAADAPVRIDTLGPALTDRRTWVCELPEGTATIACGGTHLTRLGEVRGFTTDLSLSEDGTELVATTAPER